MGCQDPAVRIKNIVPPKTVLIAMEKQMQAEREKRAIILQSEGEKTICH